MSSSIASAKPRSLRIFVADDDDEMRSVLSAVLRDEGHSVSTFGSGAELWREIVAAMRSEQPPQLLISDIRMPDFSGLDVSAGVQAAFFSLPIVLISGFADDEIALEATRVGVRQILPKPFAIEDLLASVAQIAGER